MDNLNDLSANELFSEFARQILNSAHQFDAEGMRLEARSTGVFEQPEFHCQSSSSQPRD